MRPRVLLVEDSTSLAILYKQYVELCTDNGCHFIDFNIDPEFNNCIDSLVMIELDKITQKKRTRYIENTFGQFA